MKVIGFDEAVMRKVTCRSCGAIIEYAPNEVKPADYTDEEIVVCGITCPNCGKYLRLDP